MHNEGSGRDHQRSTGSSKSAEHERTVTTVHRNPERAEFFPKSTSISDAIDASETLEEFEEHERQIAKQLLDEESRDSSNIQNSLQNRQAIADLRQNSFPDESEASDDVPRGYPLGPLVDPPPVYQLRENELKMASRGLTVNIALADGSGGVATPTVLTAARSPTSLQSQQSSVGYEPPTPPASMYPFSGYAVPSPGDFRPRPQAGSASDRSGIGGGASTLRSAMSNSFAFAGGMAAAVAGNSPTHSESSYQRDAIVYGSDLPSRPPATGADAQNFYYEPTNRRRTPSANNRSSATEKNSSYPVTSDFNDVIQYVGMYTPETVEIESVLQPFLLDYIPAVGDVDPFIKVPRPDNAEDLLGLVVLDEPSERQSDSAMLDLRLHQMSKSVAAADAPVQSLDRADRNKQQIERWIESTREARKLLPAERLPGADSHDIERLMQEWPDEMEQLFNHETLPTAKLDASLAEYVDICLALADIPVHEGRRLSGLQALFSLYSEFRNSQHFRSLAVAAETADRPAGMHGSVGRAVMGSITPSQNNRLEL